MAGLWGLLARLSEKRLAGEAANASLIRSTMASARLRSTNTLTLSE
ncbi:hypothetical protein GGQ81_002748 [Sphingomonas desiccabilis]|nr:hypothetical protein [Sphingomonas desiccabilis]